MGQALTIYINKKSNATLDFLIRSLQSVNILYMSDGIRITQLSEALMHAITAFLHSELTEEWQIVSCNRVEISPDVKEAEAWISFYPNKPSPAQFIALARELRPELVQYIRKHVPTKYIPHVELFLDTDTNAEDSVQSLIDKI